MRTEGLFGSNYTSTLSRHSQGTWHQIYFKGYKEGNPAGQQGSSLLLSLGGTVCTTVQELSLWVLQTTAQVQGKTLAWPGCKHCHGLQVSWLREASISYDNTIAITACQIFTAFQVQMEFTRVHFYHTKVVDESLYQTSRKGKPKNNQSLNSQAEGEKDFY